MEQAVNSFSKGLVLDFNPLQTSSENLTNALNATLVTMNGNEMSLLNDMGNARVETAFLPDGYVPVGVKEHGGIIYVASHNPLTNKSLIGSFPSPERNIEFNLAAEDLEFEIPDNTTSVGDISKLYTKQELFPGKILHSGDKFSIQFSDKESTDVTRISNYNNVTEGLVTSPKNNTITYKVMVEDSGNNLIDITNLLKRYDSDGNEKSDFTNDDVKFNSGYFILPKLPENTSVELAGLMNERLRKDTYNTYNNKLSGKLFLVLEYNIIDHISVKVKSSKEEDKDGTIKTITLNFVITYYYNCPDGVYDNITTNSGEFSTIDDRIDSQVNLLSASSSTIILDTYLPFEVTSSNLPEYDPKTNLYHSTVEYPITFSLTDNGGIKYNNSDGSSDISIGKNSTVPSRHLDGYSGYYGNYTHCDIKGCNIDLTRNGDIITYTITPEMTYAILTGLQHKGTIDINNIGTETITLNTFKYRIDGNHLELRVSLSNYIDDDNLDYVKVCFRRLDNGDINAVEDEAKNYGEKYEISDFSDEVFYIQYSKEGNYKDFNIINYGGLYRCVIEYKIKGQKPQLICDKEGEVVGRTVLVSRIYGNNDYFTSFQDYDDTFYNTHPLPIEVLGAILSINIYDTTVYTDYPNNKKTFDSSSLTYSIFGEKDEVSPTYSYSNLDELPLGIEEDYKNKFNGKLLIKGTLSRSVNYENITAVKNKIGEFNKAYFYGRDPILLGIISSGVLNNCDELFPHDKSDLYIDPDATILDIKYNIYSKDSVVNIKSIAEKISGGIILLTSYENTLYLKVEDEINLVSEEISKISINNGNILRWSILVLKHSTDGAIIFFPIVKEYLNSYSDYMNIVFEKGIYYFTKYPQSLSVSIPWKNIISIADTKETLDYEGKVLPEYNYEDYKLKSDPNLTIVNNSSDLELNINNEYEDLVRNYTSIFVYLDSKGNWFGSTSANLDVEKIYTEDCKLNSEYSEILKWSNGELVVNNYITPSDESIKYNIYNLIFFNGISILNKIPETSSKNIDNYDR